MKQVTIILTKEQAENLAYWLSYEIGWIQNNEYSRTDDVNMKAERIRKRIIKGLDNDQN